MKFVQRLRRSFVTCVTSLAVSASVACSTGPSALPDPTAVETRRQKASPTTSSTPSAREAAKELPEQCYEHPAFEVVLSRCEADAATADRARKALDQTDQANVRESRCSGALDLCERRRQEGQRKTVWLTVGVVVLGATTLGTSVGWAVEAASH